MADISAEFRFNKAGQGCFYNGWFRNLKNAKCFSLVYDCGTKSNQVYINKEIKKFHHAIDERCDKRLNLLIISHFDEDHVNKISSLLDGVTQVDIVVLPYLTPFERLTLYVTRDNDDYFQNFIIDPINFMNQQNAKIERFVFVTNDAPDSKLDDTGTSTQFSNDNNNDFSLFWEVEEITQKNEYLENDNVYFFKNNRKLLINAFWEFYFYNKPVNNDELNKFKKKFIELLPKYKNVNNVGVEDLKNIFNNPNLLSSLRKCYKSVFRLANLNPTSLLVYHGACNNKSLKISSLYNSKYYFKKYIIPSGVSTLLTGDIPYNGLTFPEYITRRCHEISVLQIPHHGASPGRHFNSLSELIPFWVISVINFGLGNGYNHPREDTIIKIREAGWKVILNHQLKAFNYSFILEFDHN